MAFPWKRRGRPAAVALAALLAATLTLAASSPEGEEAARAGRLAASLVPTTVVSSPRGMVVSAAPEASWAGARMLEAGGNAVDAAVAAALTLTAADPGGSGLGGQTWMVVRLATGEERAIYCPARAPLRVDRLLTKAARQDGQLWGPMAAAAPTTLATLARALARYGTRSLPEVLAPAIEVAEGGYRTQPLETLFLEDYRRRVWGSEVLTSVYLGGRVDDFGFPRPFEPGTCVRLPNLAATLRRLAEKGPSDFYTGEVAARLEAEVLAAGGFLTRYDLARVPASVLDVVPVRGTYRGHTILSVPSPAGGGILVMAAQILDALGPGPLRAPGLERGHAIVEAVRLARAKAAETWSAAEVPDGPFRSEWLTPAWAAARARLIRPGRAIPPAELGRGRFEPAGTRGTTQVSVVDAEGNAVSLTQSLGRYWGSAWVPPSLGFPLNAFVEPLDADEPELSAFLRAGAAAPMPAAPVILLRGEEPVLVAGSPGSSRIVSILLNLVVDVVDGGEPAAVAVGRPRMIWDDELSGPRVMLEVAPPFSGADVERLKALGYEGVFALYEPSRDSNVFGAVFAVARDAAGAWQGIVDGRRPGFAAAPAAQPPRRESSR